MTEPFGALSSDFYINQRLNLKMDLPTSRETILAMFDRVRREFPAMDRFRRFSGELALESDPSADGMQLWLAMRRTNIRTGSVNPADPQQAYALHRLVLEVAPYFLSISPLDVDYLELLYGFDFQCGGNHDAIVFDALLAGSPLAALVDPRSGVPIDCQPMLGIGLGESADVQAHFEIKTRTPGRADRSGDVEPQPLSIFLTLRKHGSVKDVGDLLADFDRLARDGEQLLQQRVVPNLVMPIREAIAASGSN